MSKSTIEFLTDKNIFVFDTETTGLPEKSTKWGTYWDYKLNDKYDSSRIVSIAWSSIKNFDRNNIDTNINNINHHIRYPEGFNSIETTHIHGISFEEAIQKGIPFGYILETHKLASALLNADYIVAHNVKFDYHVLMNELFRFVNNNEQFITITPNIKEKAQMCINHIENLNNNNRIICTGEISTPICKMSFPSANKYLGKKINYKMPKLCELYKYFYGYDFENAHSASGDVKALLECLQKL